MAIPANPTQQEIDAVNTILNSIGQASVSALEATNPDVTIAYDTLIIVSREVQAEGWTINTEEHVKITPDVNDEIVISAITGDVLQIDLSRDVVANMGKDAIIKSGKLYDRVEKSYEWTADEVYCDIVYLYSFSDLPVQYRDYITARAAAIVSSRIVGDSNQYQVLKLKETECRALVIEYDCNQGDYSFTGRPYGNDYYRSFKPYHALSR